MIDNETLLGFALNALEPAEQQSVRDALLADTAASRNLARIQAILRPLEVERDDSLPPPNLVEITLKKLDASLAMPKPRIMMTSRWIEMALAASIGFVGFGIVATGGYKLRAEARQAQCADNLRRISAGLNQYADTHENRFPQVGVASAPTAGHFPAVMANGGTWPGDIEPRCAGTEPVGYAYSLGHRDAAGNLYGPTRSCEHPAQMPIAGDLPSRFVNAEGLVSPHGRGQNVLHVDGHVFYTLSPYIGPDGDHIYLNDDGFPRAGLRPNDAVLGRPVDPP